MSRTVVLTGLSALAIGTLLGASCGNEDAIAPAALKQENIQECRSFDEIMPSFVKAMNTGQTAGLKTVIEGQLLVSPREGVPPPINDVIRALVTTLNRLATQPAEVGAARGQYCAPNESPPALTAANEICEIRRALELLIHQGKGLDAINVVGPMVLSVIDYIVGRGADGKPHYEVAAVFSGLCTQDANCQLSNGLDLAIGFSLYLQMQDGKQLVNDLFVLAEKPSFQELLGPTSALTEEGFVALIKSLRLAVQAADPSAIDTVVNSLSFSQQTKDDLQPVVADLKKVLVTPALINPTRKALTCIAAKDTNEDVSRMFYRLAIRDKLATLGITKLVATLKGLRTVDQRGSIIYLVGTLANAVRGDDQAIDSAASVCRTLLSTAPSPGQTRGNAELVLPTIGGDGVFGELICAADTLLFGCTGGASQPACLRTCGLDGGSCL